MVTLRKQVDGPQDILIEKRALEVEEEAAFTKCKERLASAEEAMTMQQIEAEKRVMTPETKAADLEANNIFSGARVNREQPRRARVTCPQVHSSHGHG